MNTKYVKDLAERVFWTAAEAAVAYVSVDQLNIPKVWVPVVATGLAFVKGIIAKHIGDSNTAAIGGADTTAPKTGA